MAVVDSGGRQRYSHTFHIDHWLDNALADVHEMLPPIPNRTLSSVMRLALWMLYQPGTASFRQLIDEGRPFHVMEAGRLYFVYDPQKDNKLAKIYSRSQFDKTFDLIDGAYRRTR